MRAWPDVAVPILPRTGDPGNGESAIGAPGIGQPGIGDPGIRDHRADRRPRVHDTATGHLRPVPADRDDDGTRDVRIYVCGITPYDATHLGHAATYLSFDILARVLTDAGFQVRLVQNVTDVDEPLLERATITGQDWSELAEQQIELFRSDMTALRIRPPAAFVGAVETIPLIAADALRLRERGAVYEVGGDWYFAVGADNRFGEVSGLDPARMRALFADNGGDPDRAGKKDPLDPVVWRARRPGEPFWESPLGPGRPGWHLECAAIALDQLSWAPEHGTAPKYGTAPDGGVPEVASVDVQGGGADLVFPHHEMCAAQARVLSGRPFADSYVHAGLIELDGEKMSKSRGNLVFVSRLLAEGVEPAAIRLALLAGHYRDDRPWTTELLVDAQRRLGRWRAAVTGLNGPDALPLLAQVRERLADDLDTPGALAAVDAWAHTATAGPAEQATGPATRSGSSGRSAPELVRALIDALLGVELTPAALSGPAADTPIDRDTP